MTPNEYQKLALSTLVTSTVKDTLIMCGLGIAGEAGETADIIKKGLFHKGKSIDGEKLSSEMGDLLWYVAVTADAYNMPMDDIMPVLKFGTVGNFALNGLRLAKHAGNIADIIADQIQAGSYECTDAIEANLRRIVTDIAVLAPLIGISIESVMERNIAKLQARHSGGQQTANGGVFNPHYKSDSVK